MANYRTLNVKPETKERLMDHKQHVRDTQDDVLNHVLDAVEDETTGSDGQEVYSVPVEAVDEWNAKLDRIEDGIKEATDAAQSADKKLEDLR